MRFEVGDRVEYVGYGEQGCYGKFDPKIGTVGIVINQDSSGTTLVQWPKGSTTGDDMWWYPSSVLTKANKRDFIDVTELDSFLAEFSGGEIQ